MKMGIERILKEKFGDAVKDIRQVYDEEVTETTIEVVILLANIVMLELNFLSFFIHVLQAVDGHLDILRPAIRNYGGSVEVMAVEGGECFVKYQGPPSIASGIRAAIKEKFPDIINVTIAT